MVVAGGTSGYEAWAHSLRISGSSMGSLDSLRRLVRFCDTSGVRPPIDRVLPLDAAVEAFTAMATGDVAGKPVLTSGGA